MYFGLYLIGQATGKGPAAPIADPAFCIPFARHAEELGFDSIFLVDHIVFPAAKQARYPYTASGEYPWDNDAAQLPEPLALMSFLAGATTTLRFGTAVLVLPQRNPLLLAKQLATMDRLSGGRIELGIGAGWLRDEFEALGWGFDDRGSRTDEWIDVLRVLWRDRVASHAGEHLDFTDLRLTTHPVQPGGVPIIVGGHSAPALRRAGRRGDGFLPAQNVEQAPEDYRRWWDAVRGHAAAAGREPDAVQLHGFGATLAGAEHLAALGAVRMIWSVSEPDLDSSRRALDRFRADVIDRFGR
ncbi:MAG: LLM class F420-dependent oxidoreductase [Acidimicrobiales bacterium]|nr:LLM class F420-dependent oxidoreductase [Acidimicrobiales bacterium]